MLAKYPFRAYLPGQNFYLALCRVLLQRNLRMSDKKTNLRKSVQSLFVWKHLCGPESKGRRHKCWILPCVRALCRQKPKSLCLEQISLVMRQWNQVRRMDGDKGQNLPTWSVSGKGSWPALFSPLPEMKHWLFLDVQLRFSIPQRAWWYQRFTSATGCLFLMLSFHSIWVNEICSPLWKYVKKYHYRY